MSYSLTLNAMEIAKTKPNPKELALYWAEKGFRVFPIEPRDGDKKPSAGFKWKDNATSDSIRISEWWDGYFKQFAVGIITGNESKTFILDVDVKNDVDGVASLEKLKSEYGFEIDTYSVKTPSGGYHYIFKTDGNLDETIGAGLYDGIDFRANHGYVVAAGSVIQSGRYSTINDVDFQTMPEGLLKAIQDSKSRQKSNIVGTHSGALLQKGSRNTQLASMAGQLVRKGKTYEEVLEALKMFNLLSEEPLDESEVESIAKSICRYDPDYLYICTTEQDFSNQVANVIRDQHIYVTNIGWFVRNKNIWLKDHKNLKLQHSIKMIVAEVAEKLEIMASQTVDECKKRYIYNLSNKIKKRSFQSNCLDMLFCEPDFIIEPKALDNNSDVIGLKNGDFLSLKTLSVVEDDNYYVTKTLDVEFDATAQCPVFDSFINQILPDVEKQSYVLKSLAYALLGTNVEQKMFYWVGRGQNGKSTLLESVSSIMNDYSISMESETIIKQKGMRIQSDIARLRGARLASIPEIAHGAIINAALMKRLSGGDTVTGRFLYCEEFDFVNKAIMFSPTNFIPVMDGMDDGLMRRVVIIKFDTKIDDKHKDIHLASKLEKEKSGILNLLLQYLKKYQDEGLIAPESIKKDTADFCNRSNLIQQYFDEHYELCGAPESKRKASSLYNHYSNWAKINGYSPLSSNSFSPLFETIEGVTKVEQNRANFYYGFKSIPIDTSLVESI